MPLYLNKNKLKIRQGSGDYISLNAVSDDSIETINTEADRIVTAARNRMDVLTSEATTLIDSKKNSALADLTSASEMEDMVAETFSENKNYSVNDYVINSVLVNNEPVNKLYRFTVNHSAGAWDASEVEEVKVGDEISDLEDILPQIYNVPSEPITSLDHFRGYLTEEGVIAISASSPSWVIGQLRINAPYGLIIPADGYKIKIFQFSSLVAPITRKPIAAKETTDAVFFKVDNPSYYYFVQISKTDETSIESDPGETAISCYGMSRIDDSLSITGAAADAKATGDAVADLKSAFHNEILYKDTSVDVLKWEKNKRINNLGRYSASHPESVGLSGGSNTPYVYAGTTFTVGSGYIISMSVWSEPLISTINVSKRLYLAYNIEAGTVTAPVDGYLGLSIAKADGTAISDDVAAEVFAANAVTSCEIYNRTVKTEIADMDVTINRVDQDVDNIKENLYVTKSPLLKYSIGCISGAGDRVNYKNRVVSSVFEVKIGDYVNVDSGYNANMMLYNSKNVNSSTFIKTRSLNNGVIVSDTDGYAVVQISTTTSWSSYSTVLTNTDYKDHMDIYIIRSIADELVEMQDVIDVNRVINRGTELTECQKAVADDWHFPFIDTRNTGLGSNHQIPGTASLWTSGTVDLTQKNVWMSDGTHPYKGDGVTDMIGLTIAQQLALVSPSFHNTQVSGIAPYWTGKNFLWMGTSIPASSDPDAGSGTGATYPQLVAQYLGVTVTNIARGSSCVRANSSDGQYTRFIFSHFIRSFTRMIAECDVIASNWSTIKTNILNAPETLSAEDVTIMKALSFENLLLPYLNGANTMPDLFVIDYGHNDVSPKAADGSSDLWIVPNVQNISNGVLAPDTYMVANDYANLKLAMNNDLSGISDIEAFAASVNRNCLQGALNFLIMVILSRNPYARIAIVSDYN